MVPVTVRQAGSDSTAPPTAPDLPRPAARLPKRAVPVMDNRPDATHLGEVSFAALFDESPAAALMVRAGVVLAANRSALALFGYTEPWQAVGAAFGDHLAASERARFRRRLLARPVAPAAPRSFDTVGRRRDGSEFPMETLIGRITPSDGPAHLIYLADLTDRRQSEARRAATESQLRQSAKMEAVGQLAGGIAHDFNNLMTVVRGYADLVLEAPELSRGSRDDLQAVRDAADRASALTRQLLAFSRQQVLQPRLVSMNAVANSVVPMLRRLLGEDITFEFLPGAGLGAIRADPGQLEQVVMNLAINARDAMPAGGRLTIETTEAVHDPPYLRAHAEATPGRYVVLAVSDTGIGMDEATRQRIFEPFFTTKEIGKGTGLGLATVHGIVKQSGGHVEVYSEPGHGSVFKVYLPRIEPLGPAIQASRHARPVAHPARVTSSTILLVEDERQVRSLMTTLLARCGYRVLEAGSPQRALDIAAREPGIDLVVSDVVLPGMTGPEMVARLLESHPALRVVYSSGYTERAVKGSDLVAGGAAFLPKPFTPDELARVVEATLAPAEIG